MIKRNAYQHFRGPMNPISFALFLEVPFNACTSYMPLNVQGSYVLTLYTSAVL